MFYYKKKTPYKGTRGTVVASEYDQHFNNEVEHACSILGLNAIKGPTWTSQYKLECGVTSILSSRGYTHVEMEDVLLKSQDRSK